MEAPSNKAARDETSTLLHLPSDVVTEILCRLPIKTLAGAAKCVCKSWLNLISTDADLAKLHRQRSPTTELLLRSTVNTSPATTTLYSGNVLSYIGSNRESVYEVKHSLLFNTMILGKTEKNRLVFANSCNGLLCFHSLYSGFDVIINPITSEFITVPESTKWSTESIRTVKYKLGFSEKKNRFKLLRAMCGAGSGSCKQFAEICTFEKGSKWRDIGDCPYPIPLTYGLESVILEHKIHYGFARSGKIVNGISCFDFEKEQFGVVPIPSLQDCNAPCSLFGVFRGCLSLSWHPLGAVCFEMWVMKEYDVGDSWEKLFSIHWCIVPLKQLENGDILMMWKRKYIVLYNPNPYRIRTISLGVKCSEVRAYSPTLLRLKDAMAGYEACIHDANSRRRCEEGQ